MEPRRGRGGIRTIARAADEALRDGEWWPLHPLDDDGETPDAVHGIYLGAAGVLWALDQLARAGLHEPGHDYARLAAGALESYRRRPEFGGPAPSLWLGEGGIALVAWLLAPSPALADRLAELAVAAPEDDTLELLWGSPGLLAVADAMLERTGEPRWAAAWSAIAEDLLGRWGERVPHFWTQRLYGTEEELVGAGHGLAGVLAMLARRPELLPHDRLIPGAVAALSATAVREDGLANWPPSVGEGLVHHTGHDPHAVVPRRAGVVASLAALAARAGARRAAARGRRADLDGGPAAEGPGPVPRHRGQRLRAAEAVRPHGRRALARARAPVRDARRRPGRGGAEPVRARPAHALDRRPRHRDVPVPLPRRQLGAAGYRAVVTGFAPKGTRPPGPAFPAITRREPGPQGRCSPVTGGSPGSRDHSCVSPRRPSLMYALRSTPSSV